MVRIASLGKTGGLNSGKLGAAVVDAAMAWDKANGGKVQHEVQKRSRHRASRCDPGKKGNFFAPLIDSAIGVIDALTPGWPLYGDHREGSARPGVVFGSQLLVPPDR